MKLFSRLLRVVRAIWALPDLVQRLEQLEAFSRRTRALVEVEMITAEGESESLDRAFTRISRLEYQVQELWEEAGMPMP